MNEKDKEALVSSYLPPATKGSTSDALVAEARARLEAHIAHLHDLEEALAWRENPGGRARVWNRAFAREYVFVKEGTAVDSEPHEGTPQGRAEALIRLHKRVKK